MLGNSRAYFFVACSRSEGRFGHPPLLVYDPSPDFERSLQLKPYSHFKATLFSISGALRIGVSANYKIGKEIYFHALDNLRDPAGAMAPGCSELVHTRRIHSHSSRHRGCCRLDPLDSGPAGGIRLHLQMLCAVRPSRLRPRLELFFSERAVQISPCVVSRLTKKSLPAGRLWFWLRTRYLRLR